MTIQAEAFICPTCSQICSHPLEIRFRWCPRCKKNDLPLVVKPDPYVPPAWAPIREAIYDILDALEYGRPLTVKALQQLPPWRAVHMVIIGQKCGAPLERGTLAQLEEEARMVTGDGVLGKWWRR